MRVHPALPIHSFSAGDRVAFYTPGRLCVAERAEADQVHATLAGDAGGCGAGARTLAADLCTHAQEAVTAWNRRLDADFQPECLTVYPSNRCNLACTYCYSAAAGRNRGPAIDLRMVRAAARMVAGASKAKRVPFHLALNGGGEPAIEWARLERIVEDTRTIATEAGLCWKGYLTTNGVLHKRRTGYLARRFDAVELSCDGPPDIQNRQRPRASGVPTSEAVESFARAMVNAGAELAVRTTITPATVERQSEIVVYVSQKLGVRRMRFEPIYRLNGQAGPCFSADQAGRFVQHFLRAQKTAAGIGCDLAFAGSRLDELHGSYCDVLRDVLHLNPDGSVAACFFSCGGSTPWDVAARMGRWSEAAGSFVLDWPRIVAFRRRAARFPAACKECVNQYHCTRGCPENCYVREPTTDECPGFRCRVQRMLTEAWLQEVAARAEPAIPVAGRPSAALAKSANV